MNDQERLIQDIENLLDESAYNASQRSQQTHDQQMLGKREVVLFGAGNLGRKIAQQLQENSELNIVGFSDNNPKSWHTEINGIKVYSPTEAVRLFGKSAAFIVTIWTAGSSHRFKHTQQQLLELGCDTVMSFVYLFWKYADTFLPYYAIDVPQHVLIAKEKIIKLARAWQDTSSLETYLEMIRWRLDGDFTKVSEPTSSPQYFVDEIYQVSAQDIFLDVGAFDGDTLRFMLNTFGDEIPQITCFEPDNLNFQKLLSTRQSARVAQQEKIQCVQLAITDHQGYLTFNSDGTAASAPVSDGKDSIPCNSIDQYTQTAPPTFIKMDIEGAEVDALHGCINTLKKHKPFLAVSAYHLQHHLWEIPLLIQQINPDYKLFLRSHNGECFDTICYAK